MAVLEILVMQLQRFAKTAPFCGSSKECAEGKASAPAKLNLSPGDVCLWDFGATEGEALGPGLSLVCPWAAENRKLKKLTILMANVTGKLVRSSGGSNGSDGSDSSG